jgi:hypothetical protein
MFISLQTKLIAGVILIVAVSGFIYKHNLDQRKIGAEKAAAETRKLINEINNNANDSDARFVDCRDAGFVYDFVTNKCTEKRINE